MVVALLPLLHAKNRSCSDKARNNTGFLHWIAAPQLMVFVTEFITGHDFTPC